MSVPRSRLLPLLIKRICRWSKRPEEAALLGSDVEIVVKDHNRSRRRAKLLVA